MGTFDVDIKVVVSARDRPLSTHRHLRFDPARSNRFRGIPAGERSFGLDHAAMDGLNANAV
jgi:hypothetical protein